MAVAFEIVHAVADWHRASPDERREMTIMWRKPEFTKDAEMEDRPNGDEPLEIEAREEPDVVPEEETDAAPPEEPPNVPEDDIPAEVVEGAGAESGAMAAADAIQELETRREIKEEAVAVDLSAFRGAQSAEAEDADGEADQDGDGEEGDEDFKQSMLGLIEEQEPNDPVAGPSTAARTDAKAQADQVLALRRSLLTQINPTDTVIELSELTANLALEQSATLKSAPIKLPDFFPELAPYGPFMSMNDSKGGKVDKRVEETSSAGKLTYASRMFDVRPVLVSTLQPAKKHKFGEWDDLAEYYPADDTNQEMKPNEFYLPPPARESPNDHSKLSTYHLHLVALFSGMKKPREYPQSARPAHIYHLSAEQQKQRAAEQIWTPEEDQQLKHLAYLYSLNWNVISDAFATWRKTISTDRRTEWDCMVRWDKMYGPSAKAQAAQQVVNQQHQMEIDDNTPIGSRKASRSVQSRYKEPPTPSSSSVQMMPPPNAGVPPQSFSSNRKQLRRTCMHEAMKRVMKKREIALSKGGLIRRVTHLPGS